jgi:hypothetical protein
MSGMPERFYDEEEAEAILRVAAGKMPIGGMSRERLLSTAAELGIPPEAVDQAEQVVTQRRRDLELRSEFDRHVRQEFASHLISYIVINAFLVILNLITSPRTLWVIWVVLGWGLGVTFHFASVYFKNTDNYESEYTKWKAKREGRLSGKGSASDLVQEWLALYPGDTKGATRYVRDTLQVNDSSARDLVKRYRI